jgi:superfamily II DNA/RNA helicase
VGEGTGKTLAYLLPIAQRLKQEEEDLHKYQEKMGQMEESKAQEEGENREEGEEGEEDGEETQGGKKGVQALRPPNFRRREGRPRAIVLVPNRELAEQVGVSTFF